MRAALPSASRHYLWSSGEKTYVLWLIRICFNGSYDWVINKCSALIVLIIRRTHNPSPNLLRKEIIKREMKNSCAADESKWIKDLAARGCAGKAVSYGSDYSSLGIVYQIIKRAASRALRSVFGAVTRSGACQSLRWHSGILSEPLLSTHPSCSLGHIPTAPPQTHPRGNAPTAPHSDLSRFPPFPGSLLGLIPCPCPKPKLSTSGELHRIPRGAAG